MDISETGVTWAIAAQRKYTKRERVRRQEHLGAMGPRTCRTTRSLGRSRVRLAMFHLRGDVDEINRGPKREEAQTRTDKSGTSHRTVFVHTLRSCYVQNSRDTRGAQEK